MHLAICVFKHFPHSGLSRDLLRIVNEACTRGHAVTLFAGYWEGPVPTGAELVMVRMAGITNHGRARSFHTRLRRQTDLRKFDSIIGFNKMPDLDFYFAADSCFVARAAGKHSALYRFAPRYRRYRQFEEAVFSPTAGAHILSISARENEVYRRYYLTPDQCFTTLPPGLDDLREGPGPVRSVREEARRQLGASGDELVVLFIGSGFRTKGLDRAIMAIASLPLELKTRARLIVVGRDRQAPFEQLATQHGVADQVEFLGARDDVPALLKAGDLLLHPAYAELAGAVLLEAIRAGLPLLVSPECGNAWHVDRAAAGKVLPAAFSQTELNQLLAEMLISPRRPEWAQNGLAYAAKTDFRSMAVSAIDAIESPSAVDVGKREADSGGGRLYVSASLDQSLRGESKFDELRRIDGEVYREAPGRKTLRFSSGGQDYFLKAHSGVGWKEIFKNLLFLRLPVVGAGNEWHGAHWLRQLGIDTLTPAAYGSRGRNPARRKSFIITEALPPAVTLEDYCHGWGEGQRTASDRLRVKRWLITRLATIARTLHRSGANHRDFYLCHFLMSLPEEDGMAILARGRIFLIDLHRMQLRRKTPVRWAVKDVAGLYFSSMDAGLTTRDCFRFMKAYSGQDSLRPVLRNEYSFWRRVRDRADRMYRDRSCKSTGFTSPTEPGVS